MGKLDTEKKWLRRKHVRVGAHPDLAELVSFLVKGYHDLIYNTSLASTQKSATVSLCEAPVSAFQFIFIFWQSYCFANDDIVPRHTYPRCNQTIIIKFVIDGMSHTLGERKS